MVLELRALMTLEGEDEPVWCDEAEAEAFGLYVIVDEEFQWIADFCDYPLGLRFAEQYAEEQGLVLVDRVRPPHKQLP